MAVEATWQMAGGLAVAYSESERFAGRIKADSLQARRRLTAAVNGSSLDADDPVWTRCRVLVGRISLNREYAMRYLRTQPWAEVEDQLRALKRDSSKCLTALKRELARLVADGTTTLDLSEPYKSFTRAGQYRQMVPPCIEQGFPTETARLAEEGFRQAPENLRDVFKAEPDSKT